MALDKMKRGCPYGGDIEQAFAASGTAESALATRLTALETKLAAVLAAKGTDENKTLQIDDAGNVKLVTVV